MCWGDNPKWVEPVYLSLRQKDEKLRELIGLATVNKEDRKRELKYWGLPKYAP